MGECMVNLLEEIELNKLSSLPHVLIKLLNACHEDNVCFDTLTDIISKDASLSARLISVANSPAYGKAGHLTSHKQILLYLGLETIKSIAITASVQQFFSNYSKEKSHFLKKFWKHTLYTGIVAKSLAKLTSYENAEEAYLAGLMHDIGQLIFVNYSQKEYSSMVRSHTSNDSLLASELEKYNITHDELGAKLLQLWGVPDVMSDAIKYHHASAEDILEAHQLVKIINLSNKLTTSDRLSSALEIDYEHRLFDLSDSVLMDVLSKATAEVEKVALSLGIDIGESEDVKRSDEEKQIQLAKAVRNISLTKGVMQPIPEKGIAIDYSAIQKSIMILFGHKNSCLFLLDAKNNKFKLNAGTSGSNQYLLDGIEISRESLSIVAESAKLNKIEASFEKECLPVVDKQLASALIADGIVCVPINDADKSLGVIVIGVKYGQYKALMEKSSLLKIFASELSVNVVAVQKRQISKLEFIESSQQLNHAKAREIIHEVNNPLSIIRNYLHILGSQFEGNDKVKRDLGVIAEEIDRVGSVILKCDEKLDSSDLTEKVNVNEVIVAINDIMKSSLYMSHDVQSNINLDKNVELISVNKNSLKQILTNLIKNAVEAMESDKKISIESRNVNIDGKTFVEIEIVDTGPGIPGDVLKKLYVPLESTKGNSHSGLGLSIVKNLVDEMGGTITCKSGVSGTVFSIHFPFMK